MPSKCVLVLLDGLGDRAHPVLGYRTPLQAAHTPCLDSLAAQGSCGLYHAGKLGVPLPSEQAHFAMFGFPEHEFPGRGPLEALGLDMELADDEVAVLAHFTCVQPTEERELVLRYDRICGSSEENTAVFEAIKTFEKDGISITLHRTAGMFGVLILKGDVSPHITDSNPMVDGRYVSAIVPRVGYENDPATCNTARVLSEYLRWAYLQLIEVKENKLRIRQTLPPINGLVTQRAGQMVPHGTLMDRYGLRGLSITSGFMYKGLAKYLGMGFTPVRDTRDPGRDLAWRLGLAQEAMGAFNFIHVHSKAPDRAAHTKSPRAKVKAIESLDLGLADAIKPFVDDPEVLLIVTADHSTPSAGPMIHSGEPVPIMFIGEHVRRDGVEAFDEVSTAPGALGLMRGDEFMHMALNYLDRGRLGGVHDSPDNIHFWPGNFKPFSLIPEE